MPRELDIALGILTASQRCPFLAILFPERGTTVVFLIPSFSSPQTQFEVQCFVLPSSNLFSGHLETNDLGFHYQSAQSYSANCTETFSIHIKQGS